MDTFDIAIAIFITISIVFYAAHSKTNLKSKSVRVAMDVLKRTVDTFPVDSSEHLPNPLIMKKTLEMVWVEKDIKSKINFGYGKLVDEITPELAAYHLLNFTGLEFEHNTNKNMAAWCFAARDLIDISSSCMSNNRNAQPHKQECFYEQDRNPSASNQPAPINDSSMESLKKTISGLGGKQKEIGAKIADDCFVNGLKSGEIIRLSIISSTIKKEFSYMPSAIEFGFISRMKEYIDSGSVASISTEDGDVIFIHEKYVDTILHGNQSN